MNIPTNLTGDEAIDFLYDNLGEEACHQLITKLSEKLRHGHRTGPTPPSENANSPHGAHGLYEPQSAVSKPESHNRTDPPTAYNSKSTRRIQPTFVADSNEERPGRQSVYAQTENAHGIDGQIFTADNDDGESVPQSESDAESDISVELEYVSRGCKSRKQRQAYRELLRRYRWLKSNGPPIESVEEKVQRKKEKRVSQNVQQTTIGWEFLAHWKRQENMVLPPVNEWEVESDTNESYLAELAETSEGEPSASY